MCADMCCAVLCHHADQGVSADMAAAGLHSGAAGTATLPAQQACSGHCGGGEGRIPSSVAQLLPVRMTVLVGLRQLASAL